MCARKKHLTIACSITFTSKYILKVILAFKVKEKPNLFQIWYLFLSEVDTMLNWPYNWNLWFSN
jgi:hypothetical protein